MFIFLLNYFINAILRWGVNIISTPFHFIDVSSKKPYLHKEENEGDLPSKHLFVYYLIIILGPPSISLKAKM